MRLSDGFDLHEALQQIDYLHLIVVSAAAAPDRLPYAQARPELDAVVFQRHMGSLVCVLQAHLADLARALRGEDETGGQFADFRPLVCDVAGRMTRGDDPQQVLHRHLRNLFAFDAMVHADQAGETGLYIRHDDNDYGLAVDWLVETLSCIECGFTLHDLLGAAQNTDVCTRLCFGDTVDALETWRRDLQLILPGTDSVM